MNMDFIQSLKSINLFKDLNDDEILAISNQFEVEQYPANSIIIQEGDYGDKVYFILEGTVDVYVIDKEGKETIITSISDGNYFGELALLIDGYRNNSVKTKTTCRLLSLTKEKFSSILRNYSVINIALNKILSRRLGETLHLISAKKENIIILLILSNECESRVKHFENYFRRLSSKPITTIDGTITQHEFTDLLNTSDNHYIIVKSSEKPNDFLQDKANYIINFLDGNKEHISLTEQASIWKIEHTVRKITKKTVGIALCSGGAPGAAQLGVLKVLQNEAIPIDYIVGTSVGSIIGGGYAFAHPIEDLIAKFIDLNNQSTLLTLANILQFVSFRFSAIFKNTFYRKIFLSVFGDKLFSEAQIPFAAIASDLYSGKTVILNSGKVVDAIIASNTAPVLFEPYFYEDKLLIDGVATDPLPVDILVKEKIDIKIAIQIPQLDLATTMNKKSKMIAIFLRSRCMMAEQITCSSSSLADVIIRPNVEGIVMTDWKKLDKIIDAGQQAAQFAVKRVEYLLYGAKYRRLP